MKPLQWGRKGKLALAGITAAVIGLSAVSGEGWVEEKPPQVKTRSQAGGTAQAPRPDKRQPQAVAHVEFERLARLDSRKDGTKVEEVEIGNVFGATSWYVPPPPPPPPPLPPEPPAKPTAPPLPFTYLGRYEEAPAKLILLVKGDRIYTVVEGEVIENTYLVGHIAGGQLELTYLPLSIKQSLHAGGAI